MSLNHDFILVDRTTHPSADYALFINHPSLVHIHDDLMRYMVDSLRWIPTLNPAKKDECGLGINFYGPTAIVAEGAVIAERIFRAWAELFQCSPEKLFLTGAWCSIEGKPNSGHYEKLWFERNQVVSALIQIADYCAQTTSSNGERYLLHFGI